MSEDEVGQATKVGKRQVWVGQEILAGKIMHRPNTCQNANTVSMEGPLSNPVTIEGSEEGKACSFH